MANFVPNVPVKTPENFVIVENMLTSGVHTFQLVVVDNEGHTSDPAQAKVTVL